MSRKALVLFDINGVLCNSVEKFSPRGNPYTERTFNPEFYKLIKKLSPVADVGVFTSMQRKNVIRVLERIPFKFSYVFYRDHCTPIEGESYKTRKNITNIQEHLDSVDKVLLVDDSHYKVEKNSRSSYVIYKNESCKILYTRILISLNRM